jgi:hypothetical protein
MGSNMMAAKKNDTCPENLGNTAHFTTHILLVTTHVTTHVAEGLDLPRKLGEALLVERHLKYA